MKKTNKIKVSDIDRMINEEMERLRKVEGIKARLAVVTEELKRLQEEEGIDEVEVSGTKNGEQWYEKGTPVAKFEKKGSHLKEEDPTMDDSAPMDAGTDVMGDDTLEIGPDEVEETFEEKLAAIGRQLDMKIGGGAPMEEPALDDTEISMDAEEPVDAPAEEPAADATDAEEDGEDEIEIDEVEVGAPAVTSEAEVAEEEKKDEECVTEEKSSINESKDVLGKKTNPMMAKELDRIQRLAGL